ncbi:hypothetical protein K502DRAFT_136321 [Neoconidiobolus thromboides FSU 785]|nr:hypothetical protein K502DRAFT_136321 [Neoconidiobolus thromboides FSU 785]
MNKLESIEEVEKLPKKQSEEGELLPKNSPFIINSPSISRSRPVHSYRNSVDLNTKVTPRSKKRLSLIINSVSGQNEYNQMPKSMDNSLDLEKQKFEIEEFKEIQYNKSISAPVTSSNNLKLSFDEGVTKDSKDYISGTDFAHLVVKSNNTHEEEDNTIEYEMSAKEGNREAYLFINNKI